MNTPSLIKRIVTACVLFAGSSVGAEHWPQFRGPRGDGFSRETNVPIHWSHTENIRWKTAIPGEDHSSPIVWGDTVFLTSAKKSSGQRILLRLDANTGQILWQVTVLTAPVEAMHWELK